MSLVSILDSKISENSSCRLKIARKILSYESRPTLIVRFVIALCVNKHIFTVNFIIVEYANTYAPNWDDDKNEWIFSP